MESDAFAQDSANQQQETEAGVDFVQPKAGFRQAKDNADGVDSTCPPQLASAASCHEEEAQSSQIVPPSLSVSSDEEELQVLDESFLLFLNFHVIDL